MNFNPYIMNFDTLVNKITNLITNNIKTLTYKGKIVKLPTPQRAGTYTQQHAHAAQAARHIAKGLA